MKVLDFSYKSRNFLHADIAFQYLESVKLLLVNCNQL